MPTNILSSSRRLRRKKILTKATFAMLGIFVLLALIIVFFYIPKFRIKNISVEGSKILAKNDLNKEAVEFLKGKFFGILPYDNIFLIPKKPLTNFLYSRFPLIKKITINRKFPQGLFIATEERKPEALWCREDTEASEALFPLEVGFSQAPIECAFMAEDGFIFQLAPFFTGDIFLKFFDQRKTPASVGKSVMDAAGFNKLISFIGKLKEKDFSIADIILKDGDIYEIVLQEGWRIILNNANDPDITSANLELVLGETVKEKRPKLDYIDIRFGNKIFYKLKT